MLNLAKKYNIDIYWFYGEAGHGRGLIDAMAWFGCKGPLRQAIIGEDKWFDNASEMVDYLKQHFTGDNTKEYHLINQEKTSDIRKQGRKGYQIDG